MPSAVVVVTGVITAVVADCCRLEWLVVPHVSVAVVVDAGDKG